MRALQPTDVPALVQLSIEHAAYERADIGAGPSSVLLHEAVFGARPRLFAWVVVDAMDTPVGFLSATFEFATWTAREFAHMDCLYLRERARGSGLP